MKKMKKIFALLIAMVMVLGMSTAVFAAELPEGTAGADKTITITPPSNVDNNAVNTYTVYKIFNADSNGTAISYQSLDGTAPAGFVVDDAQNVYLGTATDTATGAAGEITIKVGGATKYIVPSTASELTEAQITAIKDYTGKVEVGTVTITGKTAKTVTVPDYGYYYVTTTTGSVVSINSTNKSASVQDKNTVPVLNKKAKQAQDPTYMELDDNGKNAIAQVGKVIPFEATITVGKGEKNYVFHDTMSAGLAYQNDVAVMASPAVTIANWYTVKTSPDTGDTITITFADGIAENTVITITYSGKVTSDALSVNPATNTASVTYGDENTHNKTPESEVKVYNAKFTVTKKDGKNQPLANAGFVIKNASNAYYKLTTTGSEKTVSWYTLANNETLEAAIAAGKVTEYKSDAQGAVTAFTGLGNGTYTLVESTVPSGYNKAADSTFTVAGKDYTTTNLEQTSTVVNNAGSILPSTGGMGTTVFYIIGAILVVGAAVILVARRRAKKED